MSEHIRFITVGFAELLANLPDPEMMESDPALQDYWPTDAWTHDYVTSDDDQTDEWRELGLDPDDNEAADRYPEVSR